MGSDGDIQLGPGLVEVQSKGQISILDKSTSRKSRQDRELRGQARTNFSFSAIGNNKISRHWNREDNLV